MNCFYEVVLGCCHSRNSCPRHYYYAAGGQSVALLIYGFPRIYHSLSEFTDLLYLLSRYRANCTFFLAWDDLKKRGMTPAERAKDRAAAAEKAAAAAAAAEKAGGATVRTSPACRLLRF